MQIHASFIATSKPTTSSWTTTSMQSGRLRSLQACSFAGPHWLWQRQAPCLHSRQGHPGIRGPGVLLDAEAYRQERRVQLWCCVDGAHQWLTSHLPRQKPCQGGDNCIRRRKVGRNGRPLHAKRLQPKSNGAPRNPRNQVLPQRPRLTSKHERGDAHAGGHRPPDRAVVRVHATQGTHQRQWSRRILHVLQHRQRRVHLRP